MTSLPHAQTSEMIALVREGRVAAFIDRALHLPVADFVDVFRALRPDEQTALVAKLPLRLADQARTALARDARARADSAGELMRATMVMVNEADTIAFASEAVRRQAAAIGDLTEIFVIDIARRLRGVLPVKQLLLAPSESLVRDIMMPNAAHVGITEEKAVVARVIQRYSLTSVPVVDAAGRLVGRVTADDVRDVVVDEPWSVAVRSRLPWLYANLVPAFGAAAVVFFFKGTLVRIVTLAVWMPVVAGVGGNAGTQGFVTAVRRLVLHPARPERLRASMLREAAIGATNGIALGGVVAFVAVLVGESWKLGLVVMLAMTANLALAGIAGAAMPMVLKRMGRDPALASPVVVTAMMDAGGFALLLGLATWVLR